MGTPASLAVAALAGAAVAVTMTYVLSAGRAERAPPAFAGEASAPPAATAAADTSAALAELADRITALQAELRALDRKLDAALSLRERVGPATGSDGANVVIDAATLQRAIEDAQTSAELAKLDAMKPGEVLSTAQELVNTRKDLGKARQLLEGLLARPLTPEERLQALTQLGIAHRSGNDFESAKATLQQAIDLAGGTATEAGAWAGFQMAWTYQFESDAASARRWFDQVANSTGCSARLRIEARWNAAKLAADAGDPSARAEFAAILRECGDDSSLLHIANDLKARLGGD